MDEIINDKDFHEDNKVRFGLPERVIAKIFMFRLIYGGTAYSYASDSDFMEVSTDVDFWQNIIDEYYRKYKGLKKWHDQLLSTVKQTGQLVMPTGRIYTYTPITKGGYTKWPRTTILNYPVQGLGADLVAIARVSIRNRLRAASIPGVLFSTVHDSIDIDSSPEYVYNICTLVNQAVNDVPKNFEKLFKVKFDLPLRCEIETGPNLEDLTKWKPKD